MIGFIQNFRMRVRLGVAFGLLLALMALLGANTLANTAKIKGQLDNIALVNHAEVVQVHIMQERTAQVAVLLRDVALKDDPAFAREQMVVLETIRADYAAAREALETMPASPTGREIRNKIDAAAKATRSLNDEMLRLASLTLDDEAKALLLDQAAPAMAAWQEALGENIALESRNTNEAYASALASYQAGRTLTLVLVALALLIGAALAWLITASLTGPLGEATRVARDIAAGKLDGKIQIRGHDELAMLLASMREMQDGLRRLSDAQGEIAREHDAGAIDFRIAAADFPGTYGLMAEQINALVGSHIAVKMHVVDVVTRYAKGDLSVDMERLPGKKAQITTAIDGVKAGMQAINTEISALVDAAVAGDFKRRGDAQRFEFVYAEMINGLNSLMATADDSLGEIGRLLSAVADGDLAQRITVKLEGRFGEVADDANRTVDKLSDIVGQIRTGSDAISSAAAEIATGNNDLSQRTEQQAASLEETASSMEELTSTVRATADNARQANQLAIGAVDIASQGGAVVGKVVETMTAINASSRKIVDIISVIDGIAFQTNILALNAAVEAARAGEQGRGFAVVASEVRSLAQRSASAAKEIKQLIDDSVQKVDTGTRLVDEAGKTMGEIVTSVKRVTDIIADISAASQEQSAGIEQVNQAITQMDESTQQNAALVEEATAAARSMEQQSEQLVQTVAVFRLEAGHDSRAAAPAPAARRSSVVELPAAARRPAPAKPAVRAASPARKAAGGSGSDKDWQEF